MDNNLGASSDGRWIGWRDRAKLMRDFQFLVADDRYTAPQLMIVCARDEDRARELAGRVLSESRHHKGVEVLEFGRRLFALDACSPAHCA